MSAIKTGQWTRRQFAQAAALATVAGGAPTWARALAPSGAQKLAFASIASDSGGAIHAMRIAGGSIHPLTSVPSVAPGRLLLHPLLPVLYVLHDVALWEYLPRGAVSAYRFDTRSGSLTLLNTQPLSLAATHPHNGTVFLHGTALFVMTSAGIYNVLPLARDGSLQPVSAIRKVIGEARSTVLPADDGGTLVVSTEEAASALRYVQDNDGAQIRQIHLDRASLSKRSPSDDLLEQASIHSRLADIHPGIQSIAIYRNIELRLS